MKQLAKALLIVSGLAGVALGGPIGPPGGAPILNQAFPQPSAQFNIDSGTIHTALYLSYLVPGLCHSTDSTGKVISIICGGGGGQTTLGVNWNGVPVTSPTVALNAISPIMVTAVSGGATAQFSLDPSSVTLAGQSIIKLRDTLQLGATLYISSGTILNLITQNLTANSATFPNGLTANGTIVGNAQLQMYGLSTFFGPVLSANYGYQYPDGSVMVSTTNFAWNNGGPQSGAVNLTSATIRTQLSIPYLTPGQCFTTDATGHVISQVCTAATVAISTGGVIVSSPTTQIDFDGNQFRAAMSGTTTQVLLNGSSVTLQGNSISLATLQTNVASLGVATGTLSGSTTTLQTQVTANTVGLVAVGVTTASLQTQVNGKGIGTITGVTPGLDLNGGGTSGNVTIHLSPGSTQYINNTANHQAATASIDSMTVVGPIYAGSMTIVGPGLVGILDLAEANPPTGQVGASTIYADSATHTPHVNPNNQGDYVLVHSSVTPAAGDMPQWSAYGKLRDMGPPPWVVVPSTFSWTLAYPVTLSSSVIVSGASTTITAPMSIIGFSTRTIANAYFDVSQSSTALGFIKLSNGYGTSGQVIQSGGQTSSATWVTAVGGGGGASSLAVTVGVNRSSPTSDVMFNSSQFSGTISGSSITIALQSSSVTLQGVITASNLGAIQNSGTLQSGAQFNVSSGTFNTGLGLNSPMTFGLGSTAGHNTYSTIYRDVGNASASSGWDNAAGEGFFWRGSDSVDLLNLQTVGATTPGLLTNKYGLSVGSMTGAGLTTCGDPTHALGWTNGLFNCQNVIGSGGGGGSTLAVGIGSATWTQQISSPTAALEFDASLFSGSLQTGSTAFVTLTYSTSVVTGTSVISTTGTVIFANCASACTVTLPSAASINMKRYYLKAIGAGIVTWAANGSETFDGSATITPNPNLNSTIEVLSDAKNWQIL